MSLARGSAGGRTSKQVAAISSPKLDLTINIEIEITGQASLFVFSFLWREKHEITPSYP